MMNRPDIFKTGVVMTRSGQYLDLAKPDPAVFNLNDIATVLSRLPRFNGHTGPFYSVAQHSVAVAWLLSTQQQANDIVYCGLMHDVSETYLTDMPRPIKSLLPDYAQIENRLMLALANRFGFDWPMPDDVRAADDAMLCLEWDLFIKPDQKVRMPAIMRPLPSDEAAELWLRWHANLTSA